MIILKRVDKHDGHTAKTKNRHTRLTNCREQTEQIVRLQRTLQDTTDGQTLQNGDTAGDQILENIDKAGDQILENIDTIGDQTLENKKCYRYSMCQQTQQYRHNR